MSEEFKPEDMLTIEIGMSKVKQYKAMDKLTEQSQELGLYEIDLLTTCGTFNTEDCISTKDLGKLLDKPTDWKDWIISQIEQEGIEKYTSWYARMFERGAICERLCEAHNEIFGEKE